MPGESTTYNCGCQAAPGTVAPGIAPYVISLNSLYGIVGIAPDGGVSVRTEGNTIFIGANGSAGLGTVTSINASSVNTNLVVTGGPVTTTGTFSFSLTGALNSISGLVTSADKMIYTTALDTYAVTSLTPFARNLLSDANSTLARVTLGLVIGTDVQAYSADLADFVTNASWSGPDLTLAGKFTALDDITAANNLNVSGALVGSQGASFVDPVVAGGFQGDGSLLTALNGSQITTGTVGVVRGGTGLTNYTVGDLLYASSTNVLARLNSVAGSKYLRSTNPGFAPAWSTLNLSNSATTGDLFYGSSANTMGNLADVAMGNVLLSGGVGAAPAYGKVTTAHTTGIAASGANNDITGFSQNLTLDGTVTFNANVAVNADLFDVNTSEGAAGYILRSNGTGLGIEWTNQIQVSTIQVDGMVSLEGTITGSGTTGAQTINKQSGTVRFAAAATTLIITNSLALAANTRALATVCSVDTTLKSVVAVITDGFITLTANAAATAETEVYWELRTIT